MKRKTTISINLRLSPDLHKKLAEAAATASPPHSLNSEILARLFESFEKTARFEVLEGRAKEVEAYAIKRMGEVEQIARAKLREVEKRADELSQHMDSALAKILERIGHAEAKLKQGR